MINAVNFFLAATIFCYKSYFKLFIPSRFGTAIIDWQIKKLPINTNGPQIKIEKQNLIYSPSKFCRFIGFSKRK